MLHLLSFATLPLIVALTYLVKRLLLLENVTMPWWAAAAVAVYAVAMGWLLVLTQLAAATLLHLTASHLAPTIHLC